MDDEDLKRWTRF